MSAFGTRSLCPTYECMHISLSFHIYFIIWPFCFFMRKLTNLTQRLGDLAMLSHHFLRYFWWFLRHNFSKSINNREILSIPSYLSISPLFIHINYVRIDQLLAKLQVLLSLGWNVVAMVIYQCTVSRQILMNERANTRGYCTVWSLTTKVFISVKFSNMLF